MLKCLLSQNINNDLNVCLCVIIPGSKGSMLEQRISGGNKQSCMELRDHHRGVREDVERHVNSVFIGE